MRQLTVPVGGKKYDITLTDSRDAGEGRKVWAARCRIPMQGSFPMTVSRSAPSVRDTKDSETKSAGPILVGIASSSSVDWHGTEMSVRALDGMAKQFKNGVVYVPSHREDEWDEVFGRTIDAHIERGDVASLGDIGGPGEGDVLRVTVELFMDDPRAKRLVRMVERGQVVGWSIGGWFTEMEVVTNDDDEVERMIINDVELDHLATTRRPSNPDSWIRELQRSVSDAYQRAEEDEEEEDLDAAEEEDDKADESAGEEEYIGIHDGEEAEDETDESEGEDEHLDEAEDSENLDDEEDERGNKKDEDRALDEDDEEKMEEEAEEIEDAEEPASEEEEAEEEEAEEDEEGIFDDTPPTAEEEEDEEDEEDRKKRAVSGSTSLPLAEEGLSWDWSTPAANEVLGDDDWSRYRKAHFWYDEENPEVRASYKLPFAKMVDGELKAVWSGVKAAMAALNGARGGVDISDDDRAKVHNKIASYYMRFDKGEAPALARSVSDCIKEENAPLDTSVRTGEDSKQDAKAHRSCRPCEKSIQPEQEAAVGDTRNDNNTAPSAGSADMAATLASMSELLTQLVERDRPEATQETPEKEESSPEVMAMQARISQLEGMVTKMAGISNRQGRQHVASTRANSARGCNALVRSAEGALGADSALVMVAKDQAERRQATKENLPSRGELEADLRAVLQAALVDGVITDPDARSTWR